MRSSFAWTSRSIPSGMNTETWSIRPSESASSGSQKAWRCVGSRSGLPSESRPEICHGALGIGRPDEPSVRHPNFERAARRMSSPILIVSSTRGRGRPASRYLATVGMAALVLGPAHRLRGAGGHHGGSSFVSGVEDFSRGGRTRPASVLIIRRVEGKRIQETLGQGIHPACLAPKRLGGFGLELPRRGRLPCRVPNALLLVDDQAFALTRVHGRRESRQKPDRISAKACLGRATVGLAIPLGEGFALRPALGTSEIADGLGEVGAERG